MSTRGRVEYTVGDDGEIMRRMPSGEVRFSDSLLESMRDMRDKARDGYEVMIDGEPLEPKTGILGWLHRMIDKLPSKKGGPK